MKARETSAGFTLLEMLVVCAVIGILFAVLMPTLGTLRERANRTKANAEKAVIEAAIQAYRQHYGLWPASGDATAGIMTFAAFPGNQDVFRVLHDTNSAQPPDGNPHGRRFMKIEELKWDTTDGRYGDGTSPAIDPWGKPYRIVLYLSEDRVRVFHSQD